MLVPVRELLQTKPQPQAALPAARTAVVRTKLDRRFRRHANPLQNAAIAAPAPVETIEHAAAAAKSALPSLVGMASFYGSGTRMADGERFNSNAMVAAHRSLPFGTRLKVTNLVNGRTCVVRVADRGPFVHGRIIDLSVGAARSLDFIGRGVTKVKLERLS